MFGAFFIVLGFGLLAVYLAALISSMFSSSNNNTDKSVVVKHKTVVVQQTVDYRTINIGNNNNNVNVGDFNVNNLESKNQINNRVVIHDNASEEFCTVTK
jgi:hypothetical protein